MKFVRLYFFRYLATGFYLENEEKHKVENQLARSSQYGEDVTVGCGLRFQLRGGGGGFGPCAVVSSVTASYRCCQGLPSFGGNGCNGSV